MRLDDEDNAEFDFANNESRWRLLPGGGGTPEVPWDSSAMDTWLKPTCVPATNAMTISSNTNAWFIQELDDAVPDEEDLGLSVACLADNLLVPFDIAMVVSFVAFPALPCPALPCPALLFSIYAGWFVNVPVCCPFLGNLESRGNGADYSNNPPDRFVVVIAKKRHLRCRCAKKPRRKITVATARPIKSCLVSN